ncbi:MAG: hypothetical protein H8D45_27030 [Bacteroidetes bacterium]|nr:hypothetical protein [Bacteroidota bacterium]MBL7105303.1 hypothetical protein [Bacteroidales bacterium]
MPDLWTKEKEIEFFNDSGKFATPEQLFYFGDDSRYYAYWPKSYKGKKSTLQSRNALIGNFTEKYSVDLLQDFANSKGLYAVQGAICNEIGLTPQSPADVVLSRKKQREQKTKDITAIFEVKMSIVWNWELKNNKLICLGDFKTHKGNPGLLRSDSMLKAIGKSINIRVSDYRASQIPIIILGNTPITENYVSKVDHLHNAGIIQGFWSVNPNPLDDNGDNIKQTPDSGFIRMDSCDELEQNLEYLLSEKREFFSSMKSKKELGKIIEIANREPDFETKAEKFLSLIKK